MSFWRDLVRDIKAIAVLHDDVGRLQVQVDRLDARVTSQGERIARIEGALGWVQSRAPDPVPPPPRLPKA